MNEIKIFFLSAPIIFLVSIILFIIYFLLKRKGDKRPIIFAWAIIVGILSIIGLGIIALMLYLVYASEKY